MREACQGKFKGWPEEQWAVCLDWCFGRCRRRSRISSNNGGGVVRVMVVVMVNVRAITVLYH